MPITSDRITGFTGFFDLRNLVNPPRRTKTAEAIDGLHRNNDGVGHRNDGINDGDVGINVGINDDDVGINVGINFTQSEEEVMKALLRDPKLTAPILGELLDMTSRQAERIIASLKKKAGLRRRGARKNGEWYFE